MSLTAAAGVCRGYARFLTAMELAVLGFTPGHIRDVEIPGLAITGIVLVLLVMLVQIIPITALAAVKHVSARKQSRRFVMEAKAALHDGQLHDAIALARRYKNSYAGAVAAAGLCAYRDLPQSLTEEEARCCVERAMERVSAVIAGEMRVG